MTAADDARKWADIARVAREDDPTPRTGLELALQSRRAAGPDEISPEDFYAAYARRLLAEDAE